MKNEEFGYLLARLSIGMSFFGHGLIRLPELDSYSDAVAYSFRKSVLPGSLVHDLAYIFPLLALLIGILLLIGLFTRFAIFTGVILMLILIIGSSLIGRWDNVFIHMVYGAYLAALYWYLVYNRVSLDRSFRP